MRRVSRLFSQWWSQLRSFVRGSELTQLPVDNPWAARPQAVRELNVQSGQRNSPGQSTRKNMANSSVFFDVRSGQIASVVTYLEMRNAPVGIERQAIPGLQLRRVTDPELGWYRAIYRLVGSNWLRFSRLQLDDDKLRSVISDPKVLIFALAHDGQDKGLLELDCRALPDVEIAFLGVAEDLIGKGAGKFLLDYAISTAWSYRPQRVTLQTCTLDHPRALSFYLSRGFTAYRRAVEISTDPRLMGTLPIDTAPHCPIVY